MSDASMNQVSDVVKAASVAADATRRSIDPGLAFFRYAIALAASKGNIRAAKEMAVERFFDDTPEVSCALDRLRNK